MPPRTRHGAAEARPGHVTLGVLVHLPATQAPVPPEERPMGRAALRLRDEGVRLVFGERLDEGRMSGFVAEDGGWRSVAGAPVAALHDRFPSQTFPDSFAGILSEAGGLPVANPPAFVALCRDKLLTQAFLESAGLLLPEVEADPSRFQDRLEAWGAAFLKPRHGGLGRGIRYVRPGDPLPATGEGVVPGRADRLFLQCAVSPPPGSAGQSLRVLAQREPAGSWLLASRILRRSLEDPVVNVARGAAALPAEDALSTDTLREVDTLCAAVLAAIDTLPEAALVVEVGIDAVLDATGHPRLLELNHRPQGRMEEVARSNPGRFAEAHVAACARPLRRLAVLAGALDAREERYRGAGTASPNRSVSTTG
jgi:glutathione synthase/RimK-type ligase-like ATP-grasp enzyme